jgi:uncharacterized OB-fold protein
MSVAPPEPDLLPGEAAVERQVMRRTASGWVLVGSRCPACGRTFYPARELCPEHLEVCAEVDLSEHGVIHAAAFVVRPPAGFEQQFWVAYVDLPEGVRVFAQLEWRSERPPAGGDEVLLNAGRVRDDPPRVGPRFSGPVSV